MHGLQLEFTIATSKYSSSLAKPSKEGRRKVGTVE